jgi:NAD(P)H-dependent FMN reductase
MMVAGPLRVAVIVGSTREGRVGDRIGHWFLGQAKGREGLDPVLVDLAEFEFPASYPGRATGQVTEFAERIGRAEAFVIVTPEYNHSFPASLKQAIDYAYDEWQAKPVGFVSYGARSTGVHAVIQLRTVFTALHMVSVPDGVGIDLLTGDLDELLTRQTRAAEVLLDQLSWWGRGLRAARQASPYVA